MGEQLHEECIVKRHHSAQHHSKFSPHVEAMPKQLNLSHSGSHPLKIATPSATVKQFLESFDKEYQALDSLPPSLSLQEEEDQVDGTSLFQVHTHNQSTKEILCNNMVGKEVQDTHQIRDTEIVILTKS